MNARRFLTALVPLVLLATQPTHSDNQGPKVEITMGILIPDTSCPAASYALVDVCDFLNGGRTPLIYIAFPGGKNVERFVLHNVKLRGTIEFTACAAPLMRATNVDDSTLLPPCPEICRPGDPLPCP